MSTPPSRVRLGALALAVAGALFILYPAVRPWHDESTVDGATASMSSPAWVAAHFFAMLGFIATLDHPIVERQLRQKIDRQRRQVAIIRLAKFRRWLTRIMRSRRPAGLFHRRPAR